MTVCRAPMIRARVCRTNGLLGGLVWAHSPWCCPVSAATGRCAAVCHSVRSVMLAISATAVGVRRQMLQRAWVATGPRLAAKINSLVAVAVSELVDELQALTTRIQLMAAAAVAAWASAAAMAVMWAAVCRGQLFGRAILRRRSDCSTQVLSTKFSQMDFILIL